MALSEQRRRALVPYVILGTALLITVAGARYAGRTGVEQDRLRFVNAADRVRASIESRLDSYVAMLHGGAGLFAASDDVRLSEFRAYVERLDLRRRYPGIQGIGFSREVGQDERDRVAAEIRRFVPSFRFWTDQPVSTEHAILYLEPPDDRNLAALGYDMFAEPTRNRAMVRARDTAAPAATERVRLVQEIGPGNAQAGFLIYVPVYRGGDVPLSIGERRDRLIGFVYGAFRVDDLLAGILPDSEAAELTFVVYDGLPADDNLMHRSREPYAEPRFTADREIDVAGTTWRLVMHSGPAYAVTSNRMVVWLIGGFGGLLSTLLFMATRNQVRARAIAEHAAQDLRASQEALIAANRAKDEFLAVVSHELRTPLNAIVGWTAMLRRGQVPPANQGHALKVIERNATAQVRLVEDLLDVSRAAAGRLRLDLADVEVGSALRAALDAIRPAAHAQGIELDWQCAASLGTIRADPSRLQQIALNLLSNGIKFTPTGGRVTLAAERVDASLTIRVTDTGIGIPDDFLPHVFDRFRQADTSTTRAHGGIGLGLAIVRHLVELHGGRIEATSPGPGLGTTFTVRFPADARGRTPTSIDV